MQGLGVVGVPVHVGQLPTQVAHLFEDLGDVVCQGDLGFALEQLLHLGVYFWGACGNRTLQQTQVLKFLLLLGPGRRDLALQVVPLAGGCSLLGHQLLGAVTRRAGGGDLCPGSIPRVVAALNRAG